MRIIYVAGAFSAANAWIIAQNVHAAEEVAFHVAQTGAMPLCPHTNTQHFHGTLTPEFWYAGTLELLRRCDAVILVPGWGSSKGVRDELAEARRLGLPVFYTIAELVAWLNEKGGE